MDAKLTVEPRTETGSGPARRMRADGRVPAVVYGMGSESRAITVEWSALRKALTTEAGINALIDLEIDGEVNLAIVKDLQRHAIRRNVLHVDFQLIDRNAPITIEVPIVLTGTAPKVDAFKGMIDQLRHTLTVEALPGNFPKQLEADVSDLEIGTTVKVGDIPLPDGVSSAVDDAEVVAQGSATRSTILLQNEMKKQASGGSKGDGDDDTDDAATDDEDA